MKLQGKTPNNAVLQDGPIRVLNVIAKPGLVAVGFGAAMATVRFVFATAPSTELGLATCPARILDPTQHIPIADLVGCIGSAGATTRAVHPKGRRATRRSRDR